ncbi:MULTISPECIES: DUF4781 domain-containing protein [unclassified Inquilinus]|uniref:DUF4781 domain-containing protein n=1 Tax=unclassified Inquilinus TaxID=2645927 RepID=UPI003F91E090
MPEPIRGPQRLQPYRPLTGTSARTADFQSAVAKARTGQPVLPPAATPLPAAAPAATPAADTAPVVPVVSDDRRRSIDDWVEHHSDANGGFLGFGQTPSHEHVREALKGHSTELRGLTPDEQRYLVDRMLDRWSDGKGGGLGEAGHLADSLGDSPQLRGVVGERFALRAAALMQQPAGNGSGDDPHSKALALALGTLQATSGDLNETTSTLAALRQTVVSLGPENAARFMQALQSRGGADGIQAMARQRVLTAMNDGPPSPAVSATVQAAFAEATPFDIDKRDGLRQEMAQALAREWFPDDPAQRDAETRRLDGILGTHQGQVLLFGNGNDGKIGLDGRVGALATIRADRSITADTLKRTEDPWTNPAIVGLQAQDNAKQYLTGRGDAAQTLQGTDLDNTVGYAMGFPPAVPKGMSPEEAQAKVAQGQLSYYADGPGKDPVGTVANQIRTIGGANAQVTVLPIQYSSNASGPVQLPLFRVQTASGDKFVDNTGRSYQDFEDWKAHNELPPGDVTYPTDGHLTLKPDGTVDLSHGNTPKTIDTTWEEVKSVFDGAALVGGIIAGGILIVGSGGTATPVLVGIGVAAGGWGVYQTGSELIDRSQHGQSINPFTDGDARMLWLGLAANGTGIAAFASAGALTRLAGAGARLSPAAARVIGTTQAVANTANAGAFVDMGIHLAVNWGSMTPEQRAQGLLTMGFWGATIGVGARATGSPGEMFNPAALTRRLTAAYEPPVARTSELEGDRVSIVQDPKTGAITIKAGQQATDADIALHRDVARMMAQDRGLQGLIRGWMDEPKPGTLAYSVKYEGIKLDRKIADLQRRLDDPNLTAQQKDALRGDIQTTRAYLDQQNEALGRMVTDPTQADIEAPSTGQARAEEVQPGLGDAIDNSPYAGQGYYFRTTGPETVPEIVRTDAYDSSHPRLGLVKGDDGVYRIQEVTEGHLPTYAPAIAGGAAPKISLPTGLTPEQQTQLTSALAARDTAVSERDAATDTSVKNAKGQEVVAQSAEIGELGGMAYVAQQYPGARLEYGGPGSGSRPGDFDQVYRQTLPDGKIRFIVVEAKGGGSPLGTKLVNGQVETQGTAEYFAAIADNMRTNLTGQAKTTGKELLNTYRYGKTPDGKPAEVVYLTVRTPIGHDPVSGAATAPTATAKQFDLGTR